MLTTSKRDSLQVYTGLLAQNETPRSSNEDAWSGEHRWYADGLQTTDGSDGTLLILLPLKL